MPTDRNAVLYFMLLLLTICCLPAKAAEPEGSIPAANVLPGAIVLDYTAAADETLSGFFVRLSNCIGPREEPVVVALRIRGELRPERTAIPAFPRPLRHWTRTGGNAQPPLDIGQEFRQAIPSVRLKAGDKVAVEVVSAPPLQSGLTAGLQRQGMFQLSEMRNPFRESRSAGPVCRLPWSKAEVLAVGNHTKFDPECAPQNNSSIIADDDGTQYQFTAYYSVDEQYGGGRSGSYSRIFGVRKRPGATNWERLGLVVDIPEGKTYAGDPFVFRDLDGTPCLVYTVCDGTKGFADWKLHDLCVIRSRTKSFAGPWGEPHTIFFDYPRNPDDNKNGGRANCARVYTRQKTKDYVLIWNHGAEDMDIRGVILPNLDITVDHRAIGDATVLVRNQEEGGGGFQFGDQGYYSTWQIPWVNDPTAVQRVYVFDLDDPLNPESWRTVPGSLGFNDGATPSRDGGCTADAWAVSKVGEELVATACEWSVSEQKNFLVALRTPWEPTKKTLSFSAFGDDCFRFGITQVAAYREVAPVVEYALGENCSLECSMQSRGENAPLVLAIGPSSAPLLQQSLGLRVTPEGSQLVGFTENGFEPLGDSVAPRWEPGREYKLKLKRCGNELTGYVDGEEIGRTVIAEPVRLRSLNDSPRFKFSGGPGSTYELRRVVLVDGAE